ncbi:MAG: SAM-dependent methyltransferase [Pseudobdellovibrionaceae bacterium]
MNRLPLASLIAKMIRMDGPMSVETYWNLCLSHPQHGYYIKQDPFGPAGDFTTAPEISQLFGEMVGMWVTLQLARLGKPSKVYLVECGPGRGTLMADIMRFLRFDPAALASLSIHLVETSPALRAKQRDMLAAYNVTWHDDLSGLPTDAPVLIIGNEFLDALPIRQYIRTSGAWHERLVGLDEQENFAWGLSPVPALEARGFEGEEGGVLEISPVRKQVFLDLCARVCVQSGAVLLVDYGHDKAHAMGDTFQAVYRHQYVSVLELSGEADLTSHVNFGQLQTWAGEQGLDVKCGSQRDFLASMGIDIRAEHLLMRASPEQQDVLRAGFARLMDEEQMGILFRVFEGTDHDHRS